VRWGAGVFVSHPRASARVGFFRAEEQDDLGAFETHTSAYTYLNASLSVLLLQAAGGRDLELSVAGTNLTDEDARNHISLKKDDVLLPGRAVRVSLRGRF
jgi:iron complex outermembrane receptor protein